MGRSALKTSPVRLKLIDSTFISTDGTDEETQCYVVAVRTK